VGVDCAQPAQVGRSSTRTRPRPTTPSSEFSNAASDLGQERHKKIFLENHKVHGWCMRLTRTEAACIRNKSRYLECSTPRHALALALLCFGVKAGPLSSATELVLAERAAPRKWFALRSREKGGARRACAWVVCRVVRVLLLLGRLLLRRNQEHCRRGRLSAHRLASLPRIGSRSRISIGKAKPYQRLETVRRRVS
jgi:hypothetical protein